VLSNQIIFFFLFDFEAITKPTVELKVETSQPTLSESAPGVASLGLPTKEQLDQIVEKMVAGDHTAFDEFQYPDEKAIETIIGMGFTKFIAQKALIMTCFDPEQATEWILNHMAEPTFYDPPPKYRVKEAVKVRFPDVVEQPKKALSQRIQDAIKANQCTIVATGKEFADQDWYLCFTCGFVDHQGVCQACANVCHKGHKLSQNQRREGSPVKFYCDCGVEPICICSEP